MAKFHNPPRLSKEEADALILHFCGALASVKNPEEAARFLKDLISPQEAEMLAKRLKIAEFLLAGHKYSFIEDSLKVSPITIARVGEWLKYSGDGYRMIIERVKKEKANFDRKQITPLRELKRKYPMYYWPQIVLDEIIKNSNRQQKHKLQAILRTMDKKLPIYRQINSAFKNHKILD